MKQLKAIKYAAVLGLMTLMTTSCFKGFLDVEPVSDITSENFWDSEESVRAELNSVYSYIQRAYNDNNGANYLSWYEARSDNFVGTVRSNETPLINVSLNNLNSDMPTTNWNLWYNAIKGCNYAIHYLPSIPKISQGSYKSLWGEAHALRAFSYFSLLKIWGSVPLITKPTLDVSEVTYPSRDSREKALEQVIADIEIAVENVDMTKTDVYLMNAGSIYALAAHIYMWAHEYDKAIEMIDWLNGLNRYNLVNISSFHQIFSQSNTAENIWSLQWSYANNSSNFMVVGLGAIASTVIVSNPVRQIWLSDPYVSKDKRRALSVDVSYDPYPTNHLSVIAGRRGCIKFSNGEPGERGNENPWVMFRYADMVLLQAEAYNRLDATEANQRKAVTLMNTVRVRSGLDAYNYDTDFAGKPDIQKAVLDAVLLERRLELLGEGHRYFDLVRNDLLEETMNAYFEDYIKVFSTYQYRNFTEKYLLNFPVYNSNILENRNLKQEGSY